MSIRDNYTCDPIITNFSWRDIIYRCELYPVNQMGRPFYHLYIDGKKRGNLYFEKRWVVASKRGFSNDIGEQLGEVVEEYNKFYNTKY
ncbi:hypothetical protein ACTJIJ_21130 [Niabella sp. 22666]|uniref:hypothetical protein n=1 Tax=Niabella sp. 22666 TaxID=3453954 RepID=UPI003F8533D9